MPTPTFVLLHSPLVGPATWSWTAEALSALGQPVVVPSLVEGARHGDPQRCAAAAAAAIAGLAEIVLVGHSGAGPLLPLVAAALPRPPRRLVFVDAALPPCEGAFSHEEQFVAFLRGMPVGGLLPPWSQWFGEGAMERLVHDPERRAAIEADLPQLPLSYFETPVPVPEGWCALPAGYILLTEGYRRFVMVSRRRNWPVAELPGTHLDMVNRPELMAQALVRAGGATGVGG